MKFTPAAFAGKTVVLYFYPKDNTPAARPKPCSSVITQGLVKAGAVVFGVSRRQHGLARRVQSRTSSCPFELIADTEEKICHMFGVVKNKIMYGKKVKGIERDLPDRPRRRVVRSGAA